MANINQPNISLVVIKSRLGRRRNALDELG